MSFDLTWRNAKRMNIGDCYPWDLPYLPWKDNVCKRNAVTTHEPWPAQAQFHCEDDGRVVLNYDVPGVKKADINITIEANVLTIEYVRRDVKSAMRFALEREYDTSSTTATLEDGVLTIVLVPLQRTSPKKLKIEVQ